MSSTKIPSIVATPNEKFLMSRSPAGEKKAQPSWVEWVERNSKPLKRIRPKEVRVLTPWQKKGPMQKKQWKKFYAWAARNATPLERKEKPPPKILCKAEYLPCARKNQTIEYYELMENLEKLAKPPDRMLTKKHQFVDRDPPFSPVIVWGQPPHHDKGRPFEPPHVPCCFINDELEADFWSHLRFPIRRTALKARASPRIVSLARPKAYPPLPHCPIPPRTLPWWDQPGPKRKKFTSSGWRLHQIRLAYLSKPTRGPDNLYFYM
ncbi:uncharacterized protein Dwil_GK27763 [Drosophila willistoni]|uniref:Uncharacterized protein n=1 Tax=Drosophila willistoni TaxID=7260 RepID=A0A0Q9X722_DROWI|nr:uncharacterized protein LOC26529765 [Drosophila willistoni]KRF99890.1 uncharacterized protein Dwil_GK27763 [Drosophila willistoni]